MAMQEEVKYRVNGLVAAPFSPFNDKGEINFGVFESYAKYLSSHHFKYIFVNGTLGEGMSMTVDERKNVLEKWKEVAGNELRIIAHIGSNCLKDSQELARHAEQIGVDAIAAFAPSYYKPPNEEAVVQYLEQLTSVVPNLPFFYYCINFVTGIYLDTCKIMSMAKTRVPSLCGAKISSPELPTAHKCSLLDPSRFQVLLGSDLQLLSMMSLGIEYATAASFIGDFYHKMKCAMDAGDLNTARQIQADLNAVEEIKHKNGKGIHTMKAMFSLISGLNMGPVRLPLLDLSQQEKEKLQEDLKVSKLFE